jgi:uncharacterized lipoprotein YajG
LAQFSEWTEKAKGQPLNLDPSRIYSKMKKILIVFSMLVVLAPACAFTPQAVVVKPEIQPAPESTVQRRPVYLTVVDERPRQTLGTRSFKGVGAELTVAGDLTNTVRTALADGLQRQGFMITSRKTADVPELRV